MKIKPESEISCHITLTSVISGLFHTRYLYYCSWYKRKGKVGCRGYSHPQLIFSSCSNPVLEAALTPLSRVKSRIHQRKVAVKPRKLKSLAGCYNYRGNELEITVK